MLETNLTTPAYTRTPFTLRKIAKREYEYVTLVTWADGTTVELTAPTHLALEMTLNEHTTKYLEQHGHAYAAPLHEVAITVKENAVTTALTLHIDEQGRVVDIDKYGDPLVPHLSPADDRLWDLAVATYTAQQAAEIPTCAHGVSLVTPCLHCELAVVEADYQQTGLLLDEAAALTNELYRLVGNGNRRAVNLYNRSVRREGRRAATYSAVSERRWALQQAVQPRETGDLAYALDAALSNRKAA